jgi:hypothetical protein
MKTNNTTTKAILAVILISLFAAIAVLNSRTGFVQAQSNRNSQDEAGYYDQSRVLDSGIFTLLPAEQNARLHLVRTDGSVEDPNIRPCDVEVRIFNAVGQQIGPPDAISLRPGVAVTRTVQPEDATTPQRYRVQVRGIEDRNIRNCNVITTMEVFDRRTGETQFMHPGLIRGFNPQPDPPGHQ